MRVRRRRGGREGSPSGTTVFFSSDIHGSDVCWFKFINAARAFNATVLVMGGDLSGKAVVPIVRTGKGSYQLEFLGQRSSLSDEDLPEAKRSISFNGCYPYVCDEDEVALLDDGDYLNGVFRTVIGDQIAKWLKVAEDRLRPAGVALYVMPGNDDEFFIDDILRDSETVVNPDRRVVRVGPFQMLSCSWVPPTPWDSPRECSEEDLADMLDNLTAQLDPSLPTIMNLHSPPYASGLDDAPLLNPDLSVARTAGQARLVPVGSHAVREVIERTQPVVALHGHIHESRGVATLGSTKCVNPGSSYGDGTLDGCIVRLTNDSLRDVQLIRG